MDTIGVSCDACDDLTDEQELMAREIAGLVADKWTSWILYELRTGDRLRFSRLMERVEGISQKMLTKSLRTLERHGLVTRTMYMEVPPRVEYELSEMGREMVDRVRPFWEWVLASVPRFEEARGRFDRSRGEPSESAA